VAPTLQAIYEQHRQGLFTLALTITRCPASAEDAVHDAFARLCSNAPVPHLAYVFAAVRNAAIDQTRRERRHPQEPAPDATSIFADAGPPHPGPTPPDAALGAEQQALVRQAMEDLTDEQREVLALRYYAGLTFDQIAEVLGEPLPTAASRCRRALERLRQKLQNLVEP
jgi:RNA polymerase sigma-70 factor (ECF subfamily)